MQVRLSFMIIHVSVATFALSFLQVPDPRTFPPTSSKMQASSTYVSPRLTPEDEMRAALDPLPALVDGAPRTVFAVAAMLQPDEQRHLAAVFQSYTPALVQRANAAERALSQGLLWPEA